MDKGAHFYCCDFQVHSPRDRQWNGHRPTTEEERKVYAAEFIRGCRAKGLNAVAITDHHDLAFISYLRDAARDERDEQGNAIPESQRIIVFPGMELTLAIPCQALIIFDADFPQDLFSLALNALAISQAEPAAAQCNEVVRISHVTGLDQLYKLLDTHEYLKGRYVVLPNVSEGGTSTLLRSGHSSHYRQMPCVGGYLDGKVEQLGEGNKRILNGQDTAYGDKPLGLFQTSDNRRRDFRELGTSVTWVKFAKPTAEALRQACLARQSRISQVKPLTPAVWITSINISNSAFLGPLFLEFNSQFNAIIGGRGTGKSTILEYLRWGLCDEPAAAPEDSELPGYQAKRRNLVQQTLVTLRASVQLNFIVNGVPHAVRRNAATNELTLKIGDGDFEPCRESDVKNLLPIQAYSQKQLSNVGARQDELQRFIRDPVRHELDDLVSRIQSLASDLRTCYGQLQQKRLLERDIANDQREWRSLTEQVSNIRSTLTGIGDEERAILTQHGQYEREAEIVGAWEQKIRAVTDAVRAAKELTNPTEANSELERLPDASMLKKLESEISALLGALNTSLTGSVQKVDDFRNGSLAKAISVWKTEYSKYQAKYAAAKAKSTAHQSKLNQLSQLEERSKVLRARITSKETELTTIGNPEEDFRRLREQWCQLHGDRGTVLEQQCLKLTSLSGGRIRATLKRGALIQEFEEKAKKVISGSNMRTNKIDALCGLIASDADPIRKYQAVLNELELLALHDMTEATAAFPTTPTLTASGFAPQDLAKIAAKINPESWLELCLISLGDEPIFQYRVKEGEYMAFADASPGQQATALLWVLLNEEGPPLIIDQPEDDLDSPLIQEIVEQVWSAKQKRQLIFTSHNANLVVNGDAELVVSCGYRVAGEQAGGEIKAQGAIDVGEVRNEITKVMEGGRAAFVLRKDKYGF